MKAVKLYGARDLRLDEIKDPPAPGAGDVLIRVRVGFAHVPGRAHW